MNPEVYERKKNVLIDVVMKRWPDVTYTKLEQASDKALEALRSGKKLVECVETAQKVIEAR